MRVHIPDTRARQTVDFDQAQNLTLIRVPGGRKFGQSIQHISPWR